MPPEIFVKQLDGCTYCPGGQNCTCACEAMWLYRASQGRITTTACAVRRKTGDTTGGTHLGQMEDVSQSYGIISGRVYRPIAWSELMLLLNTGRYGFILQINYSVIKGTKYDCFRGRFGGGHAVYVSGKGAIAGTARVGDPGADGRAIGVPSGYQDIPLSLLKLAAGKLVVNTQGAQVGFGKAYAYVTPPDPAAPTVFHNRATVKSQTKLWNDQRKVWVWIQPIGTVLEVRPKQFPKGGLACYPVTDGPCAKKAGTSNRAGYYAPVSKVTLGARCI